MRKKIIAAVLIAVMGSLTLSMGLRGVQAGGASGEDIGYYTYLARYPNEPPPYEPWYCECEHSEVDPSDPMDYMAGLGVMAYYYSAYPPRFNWGMWNYCSYAGIGNGYDYFFQAGPLVCGAYVDGGQDPLSGVGDYYLDYTSPQYGIDPFTGATWPTYWIFQPASGDIGIRSSVSGFTSQCFEYDGDPYNWYYKMCFTQNPPDYDGNGWSFLTANLWNEH